MIIVWQKQIFSVKYIFILGIIIRLILIPIEGFTSNDIERYFWDGAVFLAGFDPYTITPNHTEVIHLREVWPTPEEHAKYPTIYPPIAIILFGACALAGPDNAIWVWKGMITFASIAGMWAVYLLLKVRSSLQHFALVALSPLIILEGAVGGHLDIIMVMFLVWALVMLDRRRLAWAGLFLALGTGVKFLPIVLLGPLFFILPFRQYVRLAVATVLALGCIYGVFIAVGMIPVGTLPVFFEKWRGGSPLYALFDLFLSDSSLPIVLGIIAVSLFAVAVWLAVTQRPILALTVTLATSLLVSPVIFPWYLCVLVPFLALRPTYGLLVAVTLMPLTYEVLNGWISERIWHQAQWPLFIIGIGIGLAVVFDLSKLRHNIVAASIPTKVWFF